MSYHFTPLTDQEIEEQTSMLVEEGVYEFEVIKSERKNSKAGNPMAALTLKIWDKSGKTSNVFDFLVFSSVALNIKKIKRFCDSVGLTEAYLTGQIPDELEHLCGKVQLGIENEMPKPNGGFYPKKNIVVEYVATNQGAVKFESSQGKPATAKSDFVDDDLPF